MSGSPGFFSAPPARRANLYGPKATINQKRCYQMAQDYFKEGVQRARERKQRQAQLDRELSVAHPTSPPGETWARSGVLEAKYLRFLRTRESLGNYMTIKTIGKGAFGEVKLVRKRQDGKVYALKRLAKTDMVTRDQLPRVRAERDVLAESDSEWVVKLYTTFQDSRSLYMVMEYLPGGDLMTMLIQHQIFSEDITRFYMAELIMAIEAIHSMGFVHRDIKPDNILLDRIGHIKLAYFGLATGFRKRHDSSYYRELLSRPPDATSSRPQRLSVNIDEISLTVSNRRQINEWRRSRRLLAFSAVGTPDYAAPEVVTHQSYSFDVDWWSLGTIMYECLVGWPPFASDTPNDTRRKIVNWEHTLGFPNDIQLSYQSVSLIRNGLSSLAVPEGSQIHSLICNSEARLGRAGAMSIKRHPFFAGVDFGTLHSIRAPFVPPLASDIDTSNFPVDELPQNDDYSEDLTGTETDISAPELTLPFLGYTFKRFEQSYN